MPHDVPVEILILLTPCCPGAAIVRRTGRDLVADSLRAGLLAGHRTVGWISNSYAPGPITEIEISSIR